MSLVRTITGSKTRIQKYKLGDVIFVKRYYGGVIYYHHAGIVIEVDGKGNMYRVLDFDPTFDRNNSRFSKELAMEALTGIWGKPRCLKGRAAIEEVFEPENTIIKYKGPDNEDELRCVMKRVNKALEEERRYLLSEANCQHFATEMRYGEGTFGLNTTNFYLSFC